MFYNYNEEIKRKKDRTIGSHNMLVSRICNRVRIRGGDGGQGSIGVFEQVSGNYTVDVWAVGHGVLDEWLVCVWVDDRVG